MIFSPAVFPRSGFSAFARYTNSAFENYPVASNENDTEKFGFFAFTLFS